MQENKNKITKSCCVRLPTVLHKQAKLKAYQQGITLQEWVISLLTKELSQDWDCSLLVEPCCKAEI